MKPKKITVGVLGASILLMSAISTQAGSTLANYNTTVGAFNGSAYSAEQTKAVAGQKANLNHTSNGGYDIDVRTISSGSEGTWARDVKAGDVRQLSNSHNKGTKVKLHFSNDLTTRVSTQSIGKWASN